MLNVRRGLDGSYWIPRRDKETEDILDSQYVRLPNQLRWVNKIPDMFRHYMNMFANETCYIVGKGLSLDMLTHKHIPTTGPVIALNEAIHKVEQLKLLGCSIFGTQLDHLLGETCKPKNEKTRLILGPRCANLYEKETYRIVVDPQSFGLHEDCISAMFAVMIARHFGCTSVTMLCFDGCMGGSLDYGNCIGYDSGVGGPKMRFASHRILVEDIAKGKLPITWVMPVSQTEAKVVQRLGV